VAHLPDRGRPSEASDLLPGLRRAGVRLNAPRCPGVQGRLHTRASTTGISGQSPQLTDSSKGIYDDVALDTRGPSLYGTGTYRSYGQGQQRICGVASLKHSLLPTPERRERGAHLRAPWRGSGAPAALTQALGVTCRYSNRGRDASLARRRPGLKRRQASLGKGGRESRREGVLPPRGSRRGSSSPRRQSPPLERIGVAPPSSPRGQG
jgi:hypothetical protein